MHMFNDTQYLTFLVYPRFSLLRWIELIFTSVCLILAILAFRTNLDVLIKVIIVTVSAIFVFICFFDVIAWIFHSPIGYAAWLMISLAGFLCFCLCAGCVMFLHRVSMKYLFYTMCLFFIITALIFLFDYIWMAMEYINLRRCIKVTSKESEKLDRGISTCCLCKFDVQPCPKTSSGQEATQRSRNSRKVIYPSQRVVCANIEQAPSQRKSHKCGVCPRHRQNSYSAPSICSSSRLEQTCDVPKKRLRLPQTIPPIPIRTCDNDIQEEEFQLPLFKSENAEDPGPPYYLSNMIDKRNIPTKYFSTLDTVLERESRETTSRDDLSDAENGTVGSSTVSLESSKSYQTSAASSIRKLFQSNAVCTATRLFEYQHSPSMETTHGIQQINEMPDIRHNIQSVEIKRSVETLEIKSNVEFPDFRTMRGPDGTDDSSHSYLSSGFRRELLPKKLYQIPTSSIYQIETIKTNLPSRIPIRPENKSVLKGSKTAALKEKTPSATKIQVIKKPISSPGVVRRLKIRPENKITPSLDNRLVLLESGTSSDTIKSPWSRQENNLKQHRSPRMVSSQKKNNPVDSNLLRPRSLSRINLASRKLTTEFNDNFLDYISSGGDVGVGIYCPICRSLVKPSPSDSLEKKLSGISTTADSVDLNIPGNDTMSDEGTCKCKKILGHEGR